MCGAEQSCGRAGRLEQTQTATGAAYEWREQRCPLCPNAPARFLGRRGGAAHHRGLGEEARIYRCTGCGLIFPNPTPEPRALEQHYDEAEDYFRQHDAGTKVQAFDHVLSVVEQLRGAKGGRLLDVGAGRGEGLKAALARGWEAVGLEPSANFAAAAREFSGAEVHVGVLEDRTFPENSFDAVTLCAVLEHLFDPVGTVREIHRVLKPGGMFWLDVPNEDGMFYLLGNAYHRLRGRDWVVNLSPTFEPYHVFGFTPRSLRRLLEQAGFRMRRFETFAPPEILRAEGSPAPPALRPLLDLAMTVGQKLGRGSYMDAWAEKLP